MDNKFVSVALKLCKIENTVENPKAKGGTPSGLKGPEIAAI